ncbi:hypothetical protein OGV49_13655 [Citrobacter sp. Cb021]|uniref:hypothetical protein n=1 Tax=Citrobacter sp. Cb021 TaxID=2985018 RepID=UPI0025806580|nr:hypothetical protein [Citrobacter sp. Cb021]MDM3417065.1 hypothetical protein [Citrobacter sp. Cb021]
MTTNNHPANAPVSLDRLHQISEILSKAVAQSDGGNLGYAMADAVKVIDSTIAEFGAEPVEFLPDNLDRALTILGVALPISKEEFNLDAERWMQRLINRVIRLESELTPPAPVVPTFDEWLEIRGNKPLGWVKDAMRESYDACHDAMLQAGNSPVTQDGYVLVPKKLTAENGAKSVLSGEFSETKFINCPECFGDDDCETCDGSGRIEITVPVTWTTIKAIWAKGVEHFAAAPQQEVKP